MEKNISILNDLHKYNISVAANSNPPAESNEPDAPAQNNVQPAPPPPPQPAVSRQLSEAMQRRVNDFRLSRRDLAVRVAESLAGIDWEIAESERRLQELRPRRERLASIAAELNRESPLDADGAATQSQIAAESRRLDELRLDACRKIAESTATTQNIPIQAQKQKTSPDGIDLGSVTFGQLCRIGWGVFFPFIVTVIAAALLIGAAVIAAFNGTIRW
jgi:hypothetical protein